MNQTSGRTDKFMKNVIASAILQIVTIVTGFVSPKLMLTAFGSEINGITSSITQFISYIALVEAGLANATVFALYKPLAEGNNKERNAIISASRISYNKTGGLFCVLSLGLAIIYPLLGKTNVLGAVELSILVLVLCLNTVINFFILAKYRSLLTADQNLYIISYTSSIQLILHLIIIYVAIKVGLNVILVRGLGIASMLLTGVLLKIIVRRKYGEIDFKAKPNMEALDKRWDAMFLQVLGVVQSGAPMVIMTTMLDFKQISVYSVYNMIAGSVATGINVFTSGLSSAFGNIYAIGDKKLLAKTTDEFRTAFYLLITIVYGMMLVLLLPFVSLYTMGIEDANYYIPVFGVLITMSGLLTNMEAPQGMLIHSFGKFNVIRRQKTIQCVIIIVGGLLCTKRWGLNGIMIVLVLANIYMLIEMLIITPKELVETSIRKNIFQIIRILIIILGIYGATKTINYTPDSYGKWVLYALIVGVITTVITIIVFVVFDYKEMRAIWERLKLIVKKKNKI